MIFLYFKDYLNKYHPNIKISLKVENNGKLSFLDVEVYWQRSKFATTVYHKPTFYGIYTRFDSFLPTEYKFRMIYNLASDVLPLLPTELS